MIRKGIAHRIVATALAAIGGIASLGIGGLLVPALAAPSANAATVANCANGVIVAVDFAAFKGKVNVVCATPLPQNAAEALVKAKFNPVGVAAYPGLSFICTIGGYPLHDPCQTTPTGAYWSFWYANAGQNQWTYSPLGAQSLKPTAGSVEGWFFGTDTGTTPPPALPLPNAIRSAVPPTSTTTTSSSTTTTPPTTTTTPPTTTTSPTTTAPITRLTPSSTTTRPPKKKPAKKRPTTTTLARPKVTPHLHPVPKETAKEIDPKKTATGIVHGAPAVADRSHAGSPLPAVIGAAVMSGIGVTAWVISRRRRQTEEG